MTTKHTPGPWVIDNAQGDCPYIIAEQGKKWNNPIVCNLYEDVTPEDSVTIWAWLKPFDNAQANAHLIASAPELLEALKTALPYLIRLGDFIGNGESETKMDRCDAVLKVNMAIAKAESR